MPTISCFHRALTVIIIVRIDAHFTAPGQGAANATTPTAQISYESFNSDADEETKYDDYTSKIIILGSVLYSVYKNSRPLTAGGPFDDLCVLIKRSK